MNVIATSYSREEVEEVTSLLKMRQIAFELQIEKEQSGLECTSILVGDVEYEPACDVVEAWESARAAEAQKKRRIRCPKCQSEDWERVQDAFYTEKGLVARKCKRCDCVFTRFGEEIGK
jgi:hypothetical protein